MDIFQLILFSIVVTFTYLVLKDTEPTIAFSIVLIASIVILIAILKQLQLMIIFLQSLGQKAMIESFYLQTIFKIIGIAYITEIGANITKDAGLSSVANKIELAGKVFILILAIPILQAVVEIILQFVSTTGTM